MKRRSVKILLLILLLVASSGMAFWLSRTLPTVAILALTAGAVAVSSGMGFWRLWDRG